MSNKPDPTRGAPDGRGCLPWLLFGLLAACGHARIPYPLEQLPAATRARHPLRVAVLPLVDDREADAEDAEDGLFTYDGLDFEPSDLAELPGAPGLVFAELLARHLVRAGSFREVVLVLEPADAPDAALLLRGRIRRARGYVEAERRGPRAEPPKATKRVLAEVYLADLELVEPGPMGRRRLHADLGWSILEERPVQPAPPSPWEVLGDALFESHQQLARLLEDAVLDGSFVAPERTGLRPAPAGSSTAAASLGALAQLEGRAPPGWAFRRESEASAPLGWRTLGGCESGRFEARQTQRFHRVLGPYQPSVRLWLCPAELGLELDHKDEFPAVYLGATPTGQHAFLWRLGPSSWLDAQAELVSELQVTPPAARYQFRINGGRGGVGRGPP